MKQATTTLLLLLVLLAFSAGHALAASCDVTTAIQNSEKTDFEKLIKPCIDKAASDPPIGWIPQGGKLRGAFGTGYTGKVMLNVDKAGGGCPQSTYRNVIQTCLNTAFMYPDCTAKPGGQSASGGADSCATGTGMPTRAIFAMPTLRWPGFGFNFPACLNKFLKSIQQWPGGGFQGMFASNVTVTGSARPSMTGGCASGSVSFCGFGLGGQLCTDKDGAQITTIRGVDVILGSDDYQGDIELKSGSPCRDDAAKQCALLVLPDRFTALFGSNIIELPITTQINITGDVITLTDPPNPPFMITLNPGETATLRNSGETGVGRGYVQP